MATGEGNSPSPDGLWMTLSDLARQKGITKGPLSRRVERLETQGLLTTRAGRGGSKLINVAEFDKITGEVTDGVRALNGTGSEMPTAIPVVPGDPILSREQARRAAYDADLKKLDLDERLGRLLPVEDVESAMVLCAESLVQAINQIPSRADDLAAAVAKEGTLGARTFLRTLAYDLRVTIGRSMKLLQSEAPSGSDSDAVQT